MKQIIFPLSMIATGFALGIFSTNILYVKKEIVVKIENGNAFFKSNVNHDGDTFIIIMEKDTVNKGIVVDGGWR